jgi:RimJ/RimL family protein N-acetyltransferase
VSILQAFAEDGYRVGDFAAIRYDKARTEIFPEGWIGEVYFRLKGGMYNRKSKTDSILEKTFCGIIDLSYDNIVSYLSKLPIIAMGKWDDKKFTIYGLAFVTTMIGNETHRTATAGYVFYPEAWGNKDIELVMLLGLSLLFGAFNLESVHGVRGIENRLTAKFVERFGFKDDGVIPSWMMKRGRLVPAVISSCLREDFEQYVEEKLISGTL